MYKNYLKNNPNCPCCNQLTTKQLTVRNAQLKRLEEENLIWYSNLPWNGGIQKLFKNGHFSWACDNCINSGKAIEANLDQQTYCDYPPYLAYFDKERICTKCKNNYTFKKEEQQYWYEKLGFWVQSVPKYCNICRESIKRTKNLNIKLEKLLNNINLNNPVELIAVSQSYFEMSNQEKGKKYATLARKALKSNININHD